jgi:hypothetical protein
MFGIGMMTETQKDQLDRINQMKMQSIAPDRTPSTLTTALDKQVAGDHYKDQPIQPVEYIYANAIGYFEGNVIKYVSRWRKKNGIADLEKAKHYIELLIELETRNAGKTD